MRNSWSGLSCTRWTELYKDERYHTVTEEAKAVSENNQKTIEQLKQEIKELKRRNKELEKKSTKLGSPPGP